MILKTQKYAWLLFGIAVLWSCQTAPKKPFDGHVIVNFSDTLQLWDGFGVNYVETSQTPNYDSLPQDYGGFSLLDESQKDEIAELVFGSKGLKPNLVKMFLGPHHEPVNDNADPYSIDEQGFEHEKTTGTMQRFVRDGLEKSRENGVDIDIITTLYGPPAWMTLQKAHRGRDLDPAMKEEMAEYMASWVKYLLEKGYPLKYLSLHNEGEDYRRWTEEGYTDALEKDYNMYWSPDQVVEYLKLMPQVFDQFGIEGVGLTPGETSAWFRFTVNFRKDKGSYAGKIGLDEKALQNMALITSHSFWNPSPSGIAFIRDRKFSWDDQVPPIHAWTTSTSFKQQKTDFLMSFHDEIYRAKVNGIIPWAVIQHPGSWIGGDVNPGTAIKVVGKGEYEVTEGYYFFKQLSRIGQRGMRVMNTYADDPRVKAIAFAANGTDNPSAFAIVNHSPEPKKLLIKVNASPVETFYLVRTTLEGEQYAYQGEVALKAQTLEYLAPPFSASTFFSRNDGSF